MGSFRAESAAWWRQGNIDGHGLAFRQSTSPAAMPTFWVSILPRHPRPDQVGCIIHTLDQSQKGRRVVGMGHLDDAA
ncbi:hypothetical protein GGTG_13157 [Gaeumannomyces tritici R3-111a-1]|uniref:Uncharacterized protein n=1 Tax=Gaeumannomyces tritici (strain R3-111a-1) TaxID=644352 RepID=J3PI27_GAET3|nr:hypothetical protein GGTG_13157 [Gaeumannomyces tritici R3-111a-1]EJT69539.1 hypothetical protein GGTG_13157 [Gaeumannomyces tritici R3-111a-1]